LPTILAVLLATTPASASGPRWVTGPPYFSTASTPVVWYTNAPLYFTDPGDLSSSVDHAAADALVAAAAGVWNVPTASMVLAQGGELAEHISSQNVYIGPNGPVFPSDASAANYAAIQIAVVYDTDGSVTDLLLGQGASNPASCLQNAVTESVDAITPSGTIQHALLILNGRCTGPDPRQQLQLQYQLMRAFGRILGLAWSQTNDNVFTGNPAPTNEEFAKWPVMHPIDIVCGAYTYQCMPDAFTLRDDDVASISQLYPIARGTAPAGKVDTLSNASAISGIMNFGDGQGMQGMNLLVRRANPVTPYLEASPDVSAVTGTLFRWSNGNPVTGPPASTIAASMGNVNPSLEGGFIVGYIPLLPHATRQDIYFTSESINPLYTGQYGIGPYSDAPVTPSGPAFPWRDNGVVPYESNHYVWTVPGSAATCAASSLGTAASSVAVPASGWWTNVLCGYGQSAWSLLTVQANRTLTIEVTALDEQGSVTESKLQPLIGVWNQSDPTGALPTVAAATTQFNSIAAGLTSLNFQTPTTGPLRVVFSDQRGDGRPDYNFRARVFYADSISPASIAAGGGLVTINGMGFRPGNTVTVGGVTATVVASTANTILAIAPPFAALGAGASLTADVAVNDAMSGGQTIIFGALTYPPAALPTQAATLLLLNPALYVAAGQTVALTPQASLSVSGLAAAGVPVSWAAASPGITFSGMAQSLSDSNGLAAIAATIGPLQPGAQATASACAWTSVCAAFTAAAVDASLWTPYVLEGASQNIAASSILQPVVFEITDGAGHPVAGAPVAVYQTVTGFQICPAQGRCPAAPLYSSTQSAAVSDANGLVIVTPRQLTGTPEDTAIAVVSGTQGFVSISLEKHP
jgi:hypothetical protein